MRAILASSSLMAARFSWSRNHVVGSNGFFRILTISESISMLLVVGDSTFIIPASEGFGAIMEMSKEGSPDQLYGGHRCLSKTLSRDVSSDSSEGSSIF